MCVPNPAPAKHTGGLVVAIFISGCTASTDPPRAVTSNDDPSVCGQFKEANPCDRPGKELGSCLCEGYGYPVGRTVCCDRDGVVRISMCSEWPIGCSKSDTGSDTTTNAPSDSTTDISVNDGVAQDANDDG